jgi:hypothetical protein
MRRGEPFVGVQLRIACDRTDQTDQSDLEDLSTRHEVRTNAAPFASRRKRSRARLMNSKGAKSRGCLMSHQTCGYFSWNSSYFPVKSRISPLPFM